MLELMIQMLKNFTEILFIVWLQGRPSLPRSVRRRRRNCRMATARRQLSTWRAVSTSVCPKALQLQTCRSVLSSSVATLQGFLSLSTAAVLNCLCYHLHLSSNSMFTYKESPSAIGLKVSRAWSDRQKLTENQNGKRWQHRSRGTSSSSSV